MKRKSVLKKLKKIRKLASNEDLYLTCLARFERLNQVFCLKYRFFNFCESFIRDFDENLHYLLHLNESEDDVGEEKDVKMIVHLKYVT